VLLVLARAPAVGAAVFPEWACTASHLAAGVLPLGVALFALRHTAPNALRAALVGLGAGTLGASIGELVCQRGPLHVATYHLGAWAAVALLAVFATRVLPRRAYAP
ncbi:MAG: NrsF family protein, partial [Myxococcota bacterium]|nr:NrsF family protein [Myxococcota bacterium]